MLRDGNKVKDTEIASLQRKITLLSDGSMVFDVHFLNDKNEYLCKYDCVSEMQAGDLIDNLTKLLGIEEIEMIIKFS